jgi:hypothetical protein
MEGYSLDRLRSIWLGLDGNKFHEKFKSIEQLGIIPYTPAPTIRKLLGDSIGIHFSNLKSLAVLSVQSNYAKELGDIFCLMGYYSADYGLKTMKLSSLIDMLSRVGSYDKIISNKIVQNALIAGWSTSDQAILSLVDVNTKLKKLRSQLKRIRCSISLRINLYISQI